MIERLGFVATAPAAGPAAFDGAGSATTVTVPGRPIDRNDQFGVAGVRDLDAERDLNLVRDDEAGLPGVRLPVHDGAVPVRSPGEHEAGGASPENRADGGITEGGTAQGD